MNGEVVRVDLKGYDNMVNVPIRDKARDDVRLASGDNVSMRTDVRGTSARLSILQLHSMLPPVRHGLVMVVLVVQSR
jgi:hypothetical protein